MTLMNPNPFPHKKSQKNTRSCQNCKKEFAVDGRGKPLYCPTCARERRVELNRKTYFNRKNRRTT
jgi:predicted RNA-binding Zn-ribbon protein involved in translation (DUF1610 family)